MSIELRSWTANHFQRFEANEQLKNKWEEDSSESKHNTQIDTTVQPHKRKFSSVGSLRWRRRQTVKEEEGGMHACQIEAAQSSMTPLLS